MFDFSPSQTTQTIQDKPESDIVTILNSIEDLLPALTPRLISCEK